MSRILDFIMLKGGTPINGQVQVAAFELRTPYGTLRLPKADIVSIEYANPPNATVDAVQTSSVGRLKGDLQPDIIPVDVEGSGQVFRIPKADILAIVFLADRGGDLSEESRRLVAAQGARRAS